MPIRFASRSTTKLPVPFDNQQKGGLGLIAARGVCSPEVCNVQRQEKSCKMVGVCSGRRASGHIAYKSRSSGDSLRLVRLKSRLGAVLGARLVRSEHEEGSILPEQFMGTAAGMSFAAAQVAEVTNVVYHAPMAATK